MTPTDLKVYDPVINSILDILAKHEVGSVDGERILGYVLGLSMGARAGPNVPLSGGAKASYDATVKEIIGSVSLGFTMAVVDAAIEAEIKRRTSNK